MSLRVRLSEDFQTPALRARLDALLMFASALRSHIGLLAYWTDQVGEPYWHKIVDILARVLVEQISLLTRPDQATTVWEYFLNDLTIASVTPEVRKVLSAVGSDLASSVASIGTNPDHPLSYLQRSNKAAATHVSTVITRHIPACKFSGGKELLIHFDPKGEQYCASSARPSDLIRWAFQCQSHSLWGALVADRVLAHEYFCHLLPVNTFLSSAVREGFLDGVLHALVSFQKSHQSDPATTDYAETRLDFALHKFRLDLTQHYSIVSGYDGWALRNLAGKLTLGSPNRLWEYVGKVLSTLDGSTHAHEIESSLLRTFAED